MIEFIVCSVSAGVGRYSVLAAKNGSPAGAFLFCLCCRRDDGPAAALFALRAPLPEEPAKTKQNQTEPNTCLRTPANCATLRL